MSLHLFFIDDELRAVSREFELHFSIKIDDSVVDKIFSDFEHHSQIAKKKCYTLYQDSGAWFPRVIQGIVEEHEPESIWLQSSFGFQKQKQFEAFFKNRT